MKEFMFDPNIFIHEPYWDCPKCNSKASFGVISIGGNHYQRSCKECRHSEGYSLPQLNKKIIYIDQFAISNMEKALNPKVSPEQKKRIDRFWVDLFNLLDTLCKMQLIVCPDSITHENESMVAKDHYKALKRMYEQLSHGTSFEHFNTIEKFQICEVAENWIQGNPDKELEIDIETAVHGDINEWQDRLIVSVEISNFEKDAILLNENKRTTQEQMSQLFETWRQLKDFNFEKQWDIEVSSYGRTIIQQYFEYIKEFAKAQFGVSQDYERLANTTMLALVHSIVEVFKDAGLSEEDAMQKAFGFLRSPSMKNVPFLKISTLMYAALARKAAAGQKKVPKASFFNDVRTISCLKPYYDAMIVDNECASLLNEEPLRTRITGGAKIFSLNTKEQFLVG